MYLVKSQDHENPSSIRSQSGDQGERKIGGDAAAAVLEKLAETHVDFGRTFLAIVTERLEQSPTGPCMTIGRRICRPGGIR